MEIFNDKYWESIPYFIPKHVHLPSLGVCVLGYFPYHTAKLQVDSHLGTHCLVCIPRSLFKEFEELLQLNRMTDNKSVYICHPMKDSMGGEPFAIMLKDDYAMIGSWSLVVQWNGKPLKVI